MPPPDPQALLKSRSYVQLLVLAALLGVPVSAASYGFLVLVDWLQEAVFTDLPGSLGFDSVPVWLPLPLLALAGLLTALAIKYLPGTGGHSPADGFQASGPLPPAQVPGVLLAALATLAFGAVLGQATIAPAFPPAAAPPAAWRARHWRRAQCLEVVEDEHERARLHTLLGERHRHM
jgi:H+/Cl- antiporter ClcA